VPFNPEIGRAMRDPPSLDSVTEVWS